MPARSNLGESGKESEIYFADFNDVVIGEDGAMTVDFSKEATYKDGWRPGPVC